MKLKGKTAVVTGASAGMGRAIALLFAREGAAVVAVARRKERLEEIAREAESFGGKILAFQGDVSNREEMDAVLDETVSKCGKIDILVNNAGIMDEMMPVGEATDELWDRVLSVNLTGPFRLCRKAVNLMLRQGGGNIINVASVGGLQGSRAGAAYTSSKFGLVGLTKNIGFMYADKGIRCNAICPGGVETEIGIGITNPSPFGLRRASAGAGFNPRMGSSEEIAKVALFLASEDSSFVNGSVVVADGGWIAY